MKKLFASMMAATMVAGMAVTAFAYAPETGATGMTCSEDFGLIGAYTDKGGQLTQTKQGIKIDGGDKLYFPILVSGEELNDQKDNAGVASDNKMYFATKASEVKDLKASVKDEIGGKYIDSASIVKKDINIDKSGNTVTSGTAEVFTADLSTVVADVKAEVAATPGAATPSAGTVGSITLGANLLKTNEDLVVTVAGDGTNAIFTYNGVSSTPQSTGEVTIGSGGDEIKFTPDSSAYTAMKVDGYSGTVSIERNGYEPEGVKPITFKVGGTGITVTASAKDDTAKVLAALLNKEVDGYKVTDISNPAAVVFTATTVGDKTPANVTTTGAKTSQLNATPVKVKDGTGATASGTELSKVYCVEVKMSDYFKPEETEVEFNIKLKDGGRVAFDTDDNDKVNGAPFAFNGTFDLGRDTETLSAKDKTAVKGVEVKKFKKGEIEILIGKDTRSVQLDEAFESDGTTKEDITNIYIENDKTIDDAFTFDVKASSQDDLYLELNQDAVKDLAVSNQKADLTFFNFPGNPEFDFSGKATFAVEDDDEDYFFYEIVDGELVDTNAKYNDDDGVFELRTNKLTSYVISDKKLETAEEKEEANDEEKKDEEATGGEATDAVTPNPNGGKGNANTGAADLIGVASALAVVSVAAAGAVALKK